ncbi:kinase [Chlorella sorokiniana]|uniref:Kinase n=1 Tax=Chlorella sorokiniana TaxID=3076 RepID=A0A2P6TU99_CHLSO|nr:kinase [Chlorella sorokiniana]|eukprot:PRW57648.1 kinase [Chlorella sorokiniana]
MCIVAPSLTWPPATGRTDLTTTKRSRSGGRPARQNGRQRSAPCWSGLDMRLDAGSAGVPAILSRLTQLQRLQLGGSCSGLHWTDLQPLTGLTHLAFKCTSFRHLSNPTALMQLRHLQWNDEEAHLHLSTAGEPVLEELTTDCLTSLPPQLAAAASLRSLTLTNARFELAISAIDTLLALPHLACLTLPRRLSEAGWQAVQQLRRARPGLSVEMQDLPDDALERVFVLAGQEYYPAIVGVSKRWSRLCWGSRQLWQRINLRGGEPGPPIATYAAAAAAADEDRLLETADLQQRQLQRQAAWQAAKCAQLERAGRLAEAVSYDDSMAQVLPLAAALQLLSPDTLTKLDLSVQTIQEDQAALLAAFTGLSSLTLHTPQGGSSAWPVLRQLPRLQHLHLGAHRMGEQLIAALLPLTSLTRLAAGWRCHQAAPEPGCPHQPVLQHLATDGFPSVPPQLTAVTSLRSLDFAKRRGFELTAECSEAMMNDLPDDLLERVYMLAGKELYPAIVGVSKRWWRVCWGSKALWRHLTISQLELGPPINASGTSSSARGLAPKKTQQEVTDHHYWRLGMWRSAQQPKLGRIGHLVEEIRIEEVPVQAGLSLTGLITLLSPQRLTELELSETVPPATQKR